MYLRSRLSIYLAILLAGTLLLGRAPAQPAGASPPAPIVPPNIARYHVERVATREQRSAIVETGAEIERIETDSAEIIATPQQRERVAALGFALQPSTDLLDFQPGDEDYHTYDELTAEIQAVAAAHPDIVEIFSIGRSYEGRELWAAKISDNVQIDEAEPEALFVGHYHAREHLTVEMLLYILHMLTGEYGVSADVTEMVDSREIFLVFDMNPDGGEYDIATGSYLYWRKNRQPNFDGSVGTDLNRNHSYRWGGPGSSSIPDSYEYHGTAPASAPEVAALQSFVNSRVISDVQQITVAITFHTPFGLVLWPYGYTYDDLPEDMQADDHDVFVAMGQAMAATNGYFPEQASDMYMMSGDFTDWAYGVHRIFAYTFEMGTGTFYLPGLAIPEQTARNRAAVLYLLSQAECPYQTIGKASEYCGSDRFKLPFLTSWLPFIDESGLPHREGLYLPADR